jgi:beta-barrel assembly-enhancing protease
MSGQRFAAAALAALALAGCQTPLGRTLNRELGAAGGRMQHGLAATGAKVGTLTSALSGCSLERRKAFEMDAEQEYSVGRTVAARQLAALDVAPLPASHPTARYVSQVGTLLALVAETTGNASAPDRARERPERVLDNRPWPLAGYRFLVLPVDEKRATASPGGTVMVTTGLLRALQSEEELAAVLAHEVAHVQRGHGVEILKAYMCQHAAKAEATEGVKAFAADVEQNLRAGTGAVGLRATNDPGVLSELLGKATEGAFSVFQMGYPEEFELEADRMAVRHLASAGYRPGSLKDLFLRLRREAKGADAYARTHPSYDARLRTVQPRLEALTPAQRTPAEEAVAARTRRFREALAPLTGTVSAR